MKFRSYLIVAVAVAFVGRASASDAEPAKVAPVAVDIAIKDGRFVVKWESDKAKCVATASQAEVADGVLTLTGTVKLNMTIERPVKKDEAFTPPSPAVNSESTVWRITVSLKDGQVTFPKQNR